MDTPIKLLVDFVSDSKGGASNTSAQTGDALGILCIVLFAVLCASAIFVFKRHKLLANKKYGNNADTVLQQNSYKNKNYFINKKSFKVFIVFITIVCSLLLGCCFSQSALADNEAHLAPDTNKITAKVSDNGNITFSSCNIKNISSKKYTLSECSVSITQEAKAVDALNSSKLTINGFGGTVYNDIPNGIPHEVSNITPLDKDESTKFSFSIENLSKDSAMSLCGKSVFEISLKPVEDNNMSINPTSVNDMTVDGLVNSAITTESDGSLSVEDTDYLSGKITGEDKKSLEVAALKYSDSPQTIKVKQAATDKYAAATVTFTVNKINRKSLTISLDPESVESLVIDQSQDIDVVTDSTGKISVTNTDYLSGSVDETSVSVRALKASATEQKITINQEASDKYLAATATFTVSKIEKKDANLMLDPSYAAQMSYKENFCTSIHTDSPGKLQQIDTDYLNGYVSAFQENKFYVTAMDTSETERSIQLNQEETDFYKSATVTFTVGKIIKCKSNLKLLDPSIDKLEIYGKDDIWVSTGSDGSITTDNNEYIDSSYNKTSNRIEIYGKKITNKEQIITVRQAESKYFESGTTVFSVKEVVKAKTSITFDPKMIAETIEGNVNKVNISTNSSGAISTEDTEYLKGSVEKSGDKTTLNIKALKASDKEQSIVINIAETDTHRPGSETLKFKKIYESVKYPLQEENNTNYAPVFNGKAIDNGYCFYYYDDNQSEYIPFDDNATMSDLANYIGNIYVGVVDQDKTPSKSHKCIGIRCVNQSFNEATDLSTSGGGTATSYKGGLDKEGEHWCGLDWKPSSPSSSPTPNIKFENSDPSIEEDIDTSVSIDDIYSAYGSKVFDTNTAVWSCVASNKNNAFNWDSASKGQHKWGNNTRTDNSGIVFSKTFGGGKRVLLQADGHTYFPVFNEDELEQLGFKFYDSIYSNEPLQIRVMDHLLKYTQQLYIEIEPGKGHDHSGKCVAVRFVNESFNDSTQNSDWDPSTFVPRQINQALNYTGNSKLPIEHWCGLDWRPEEEQSVHPFPEVTYHDDNKIIHTDVSIGDVWSNYTSKLPYAKVISSSVAYDEDTCLVWFGPRHQWEFWARDSEDFLAPVFSRTFS